jgi:hypothetical protein
LQCRAVSGGQHHSVDIQRAAVAEHHTAAGKPCDLGVHLDASGADVGHGPDVQKRDVPVRAIWVFGP